MASLAEARSRDDVMADAARFTQHGWEMKAANQKGTCTGSYKSDHAIGAQVGLPYAWGGWMTLDEFDKRIAAGSGAGSHSKDGILSCVAGVDCSGFVSQVWKLKQRQSTSTMSTVTKTIKLEDLRPGDALNKAGEHIVLFAGLQADGRPIIYEASGGASRVRMATPSWSYLSGYQPVRYTGIEESPTVAATTPATPGGTSATAKATTTATTPATTSTTAKATATAPATTATTPATVSTTAKTTTTPATTVPASTTQPATTTPATTVPATATQPALPAGATQLSLRYGTDVGFQPMAEDAQAIGPDYLAAGPGGMAAFYDRVRRQVVVVARAGTHTAFDAGHADGLSVTPKGDIVVMDGGRRQDRIYDQKGKLLRTIDIPSKGLLGTLTLEDGVLYHLGPDGQRHVVGEMTDGGLRPPRPGLELSGEQMQRLREIGEKTGVVEVGGEKVPVPASGRISGRLMGPWTELAIALTDARGNVEVHRTLHRPGRVVTLPGGREGAYVPISDLAVDREGSAVYLAPAKDAVAVVWINAK
jgi:hypothetical protein